ncbi:alkaline phosphatase family protein [Streptomyces sp. NBC_00347]|uniref:alkaline phosphatase family protein n=1 Tax=Streptomyces sp. NBC_00347 TaxID=2975721 RepID=UPI00224E4924|nr:nucleotide pyrophosphatase/phosphodiesterase family protein [Streptomyces sp. NBC_00347]MCX5126750.1 alkaline phosphatase family protein [Streptomyces sp. NBC_00347]
MSVVVLDVVGLTPRALADMPRLRAVADTGFRAELETVLPAVTCSVQSTFLTGELPSGHGIVGNGWYDRDMGEVAFWRQHNRLVGGEKLWQTARRTRPDLTVANICWWYAMGADVDITVTPRPVYHYDGRKSPDCYTNPPELRDALTAELGAFPLFDYWGPRAGLASTRWIIDAARQVVDRYDPDLTLVYVPHLDYDLQRFGPDSAQARKAARELDEVLGPFLDETLARGTTVVALSEYGITEVRRPVDINRALRRAGLLNVFRQQGMEYLDPWTSPAFATADHQIAHVYVADPADVPRVREVLRELDGIDEVLDRSGQADHGLDHARSGELVAVAAPDSWFTYYYWLDDEAAPDFARGVDIHRKPGYDPAELFFDPGDPLVMARAAVALAKLKLGIRGTMAVVPTDPGCVRGSHGRLPAKAEDAPVLLCSAPDQARARFHATEVKQFLLSCLSR